jgi:hypothetical protein
MGIRQWAVGSGQWAVKYRIINLRKIVKQFAYCQLVTANRQLALWEAIKI